ncbi:hypothetical protein AMELA_G00129500 [Ameiurus melas]|uniref:Uncharacterized protein n=1 Tax=Ameiurus melas TaxID=219545 RepID=A0A7J6AP20_AMEME|nr:hypothetical protein AMELA_G00129500 [Ameiurus melas]
MGSFTLGKAAPLELLLDACITAFDDDGKLNGNLLPRTFLLMHRCVYVSGLYWRRPRANEAEDLLFNEVLDRRVPR